MTSLDIITVTYRSTEIALRCVKSVAEAKKRAAEIELRMIVLDNASEDGTIDRIAEEFPWVEALARRSNDGFAVACNEGIAMGSSDYVLLLNPDTEIDAHLLSKLVRRLEMEPNIGVIGPRLVTADGSFDHAAKRNSPGPMAALTYLLGQLLRRDFGSDYLAPSVGEFKTGDVDAVNGAFMLMPRSGIERTGMLDESYWMYGEDLDLCRRFRAAGYRVVYDGTVTALHVKGASSGRVRGPRTNWHFHASMWRYYRSDPSPPSLPQSVFVGAGIGLHWLVASVRWLLLRARTPRA